ncbi:MAG: hypothetical protein JXB62_05975 [Pirellulales bacterium]|nr:hypothetical protein [Pirellulales bacterium]
MSGTLPSWIERLLGFEAKSEEGTIWSLETTWIWPPWVTLLFVIFSVMFVVAIYLREGRSSTRPYRIFLAVIRLSVMAVVLLMIAQVAVSLQRTGLPYVAVVVDDSLSMTIADRYDPKLRGQLVPRVEQAGLEPAELSRWNLARTLLLTHDAALLKGIAGTYKLRTYFLTGARPATWRAPPEPSSAESRPETSGPVVPEASDAEAEVLALAEEIRQLKPTGQSTRLGTAVRDVLDELRGSAPAGVVLLTDGINTEGPPLADAASLARRRGVPLLIVGLGSDQPVKDLHLSDLLVDPLVFVDDVVNFELNLTGTGFEGTKVTVVLREQSKPDVLARAEATVGPDGQPQQVRLAHRPTEVGRFRYVVEVEPQEGELQTDNNRQERTVEVRKEKIRVLLVQAYPSYEFRFLREMLRRDETIELSTVLQEADPESVGQDPSALPVFPVRRDELFSYDVIILGDANPALLSPSIMQNLVDFVDQSGKGGALVLIAGARYMPSAYRDTPLARLMPVNIGSVRYPNPDQPITEGFMVRPTELGLDSPAMQLGDDPAQTQAIWHNLSPLYWLLEIPELKPGARVLAEHPTRRGQDGQPLPVICMQYVGAGKVVLHATDETWRWRQRVGDVFFARYWIQMLRYLSRSKLADRGGPAVLTTDRREYAHGDSVRLRVRFSDERLAPAEDDGVVVVVGRQGHKTERVQLHRATAGRGIFEGVLTRPPVGKYHAWVATAATEGRAAAIDFSVLAPPGEFERVRVDTAAMQQAAEQTGGRYYTFATANRLLEDLPPGRQVPIGLVSRIPLWNRWPVLLLFLILLMTEWILRKLGGMV